MNAYTIDFDSISPLTDEQFCQLCRQNPDIKFERNAKGELIIMSPTGGETGRFNFSLALKLGIWNEQTQLGMCLDSSTGFKLPKGAGRSPDLAWVLLEKWNNLTLEQREKFIPLCLDFVLELRSASDNLKLLQKKIHEYIENGILLGWLMNRQDKQVEIYRQGREKEVLNNPDTLLGEDVLPGFLLNLYSIW